MPSFVLYAFAIEIAFKALALNALAASPRGHDLEALFLGFPAQLQAPRICPSTTTPRSALRVAALGRKNFLFVGHDEAGENLAGLYSLIATCEAHQVNPVDYLADVLLRVQSHPASRVDELLPQNWRPPSTAPPG